MIVSSSPPSGIWGRTSTSIHSPAFDCVVITARRGLISRRWQTTILRGDPTETPKIQPFGSFSYLRHLTRTRVLAIHGDVADYINQLGEQGTTLFEAFDRVTLFLAIQRFIEKRIEIYEDTQIDEEARGPQRSI